MISEICVNFSLVSTQFLSYKLQILEFKKTLANKKSAARVEHMRKYHEEMENTQRVTKQLLQISSTKKRVESLLSDLDAPISKTRDKETAAAKQSLNLKLDHTLKLKEEADVLFPTAATVVAKKNEVVPRADWIFAQVSAHALLQKCQAATEQRFFRG